MEVGGGGGGAKYVYAATLLEVKGILLYQGLIPKTNFVDKISKAQRGMFCRQNWSKKLVIK